MPAAGFAYARFSKYAMPQSGLARSGIAAFNFVSGRSFLILLSLSCHICQLLCEKKL
jgi:hypothetical protein